MANDLAVIMAGFDRMEGQVLDTAGVIGGTTGTVAPGATGSNGFRVLGGKDAQNVGAPDPEVTPDTGDDSYLGGFIFPSAQARKFIHTAAVLGLDINGIINSTLPYAIGSAEVGFLDVQPFLTISMALILTSQAKSAQGSNLGQGEFSGYIIPQIQGVPLGRQTLQERAAGISRIGFVESQAAQFPWGETFKLGVHAVQTAILIPWIAPYRLAMYRATGDGSTVTFGPLLYQPASVNIATDVSIYVNGYKQSAGVTVNQTAQTITFISPPANGSKICIIYGHL